MDTYINLMRIGIGRFGNSYFYSNYNNYFDSQIYIYENNS